MYTDDPRQSALDALHDGDFELAERHLRGIVAEAPDDPAALALLALCLLALQRAGEAADVARRAAELAPGFAFAQWALGSALLAAGKVRDAERAAAEALRLDPDDADHHALLARVHGASGRWAASLAAAEQALARNPEHGDGAALRAFALRQLGRTDEAHAAFEEAVSADPLNSFANAGKGWLLLQRGQRGDAAEQFREALRLDPESQWAREGLAATLKARNPLYRMMLRYFMWMSGRSGRERALFVVGGLLIYNFLRRLARQEPALAPVVWPLLGAYIAFLFLSWLADPLFDLLLRFSRDGRRVLSRDQVVASNWVGACLATALGAGGWALVTGSSAAGVLALCSAFLLIPVAGTFHSPPGWRRTAMGAYTAALAATAVTAAAMPEDLRWPLALLVVLGAALGSWVARLVAR